MIINQIIIICGVILLGIYAQISERNITQRLTTISESSRRVELTVYSIGFETDTYMMYQIRTATKYPLPIFWKASIINPATEEVLCKGNGSGTVEDLTPYNTAGPWTINYWVGDDTCLDRIRGQIVVGSAQWNWTDENGKPQVTGQRTSPILIPETLVQHPSLPTK